jgi:hypothetical protein
MNETEIRFRNWAEDQFGRNNITTGLPLALTSQRTYTPDFIIFINIEKTWQVDVKACWRGKKWPHVEDDARIKIAVAAEKYPHYSFFLAYERPFGSNCWVLQQVKG